jgi:hypothetical protein
MYVLSAKELYFIKSLSFLPRNDAAGDVADEGDRLLLRNLGFAIAPLSVADRSCSIDRWHD